MKGHRHNLAMDAVDPQGAWLMTLAGKGYYRVAGVRHALIPGTVLALPRPAQGELIHTSDPSPWRSIWVHVAGQPALDLFHFIVSRFGILHKLPIHCGAVVKARRLVRMAKSRREYTPHEWSLCTFDFLNTWWACCEKYVTTSSLLTESAYDSRVLSFHPGSVQQYAQKMGYSRSYLARKLKEQWKEPPGRVLRRARLEEAARLLRSTNRAVSEIAAEVGYQSDTAFNRAFKRAYKQPPLRYRHARR